MEADDFDQERARIDKGYAVSKILQYKTELKDLYVEKDKAEARILGLEGYIPWIKATPVLERNDCSRKHKLQEAFAKGRVLNLKTGEISAIENGEMLFRDAESFVVSNDWAGALGAAIDEANGEMKLPFPMCCFEFRISGATALIWVGQHPEIEGAEGIKATGFLDAGGDYWLSTDERSREEPFFQFAWRQIKAICVALDAEVATREVMRAPHALNVKRAKQSKPLIKDYHVVSLAKRYRCEGQAIGDSSGRHPRLHFRRGHWRHYEMHKTWINWMLVGNPDLGFIAKHYSL